MAALISLCLLICLGGLGGSLWILRSSIGTLLDRQSNDQAPTAGELRYRDLVQTANCIIMRWDTQGRILFLNQYGLNFFGFPDAEILGHNVVGTIVAPRESSGRDLRQLMQKIQANPDGYWLNENENICRNGRRAWINWANRAIRDSSGQVVEILSIGTDISDRKRAEEALRTSQAKFQRLVDDIGQDFVVFSHRGSSGIITYVSGGFEAVFGVRKEQFIGQPWMEVIPWLPEDIATARRAVEEAIAQTSSSQKFEMRFIHPSGERRTLAVSQHPVWGKTGELLAIDGIVENITAHRAATEKLAQQFQRAQLLTSITQQIRQNLDVQAIYQTTVDQIGQALRISRCVLHVYGEAASGLTTTAEYRVASYPSMADTIIPVIDNPHAQVVLSSDRAISTPNVDHDPLLATALPLCQQLEIRSMLALRTSYQGKPNGIIGMHQCDRYRTWTAEEIELVEAVAAQVGIAIAQASLLLQARHQSKQLAEKNRELDRAMQTAAAASQAKSDFLANMSHELRTPLNAILGFSQLMAKDPSFSATQTSHLRSINHSGNHLLSLINAVLDMSKIEAGRSVLLSTTVNLPGLITDTAAMFEPWARDKQLTLVVDLAPDLPACIETDGAKLRQILVNLLSNAVKFTQAGSVTVRCRCLPLPIPADQSAFPRESLQLQFEVADTGDGIAPADLANIFEPFVQSETGLRHRTGTGLGLSISHKFVELMGGQMTVSSRQMTYTPGQPEPTPVAANPQPEMTDSQLGSRFCFTIRALVPSVVGRRVTGLAPGEAPRRILIVENCQDSRQLLEQILSPVGFELRSAGNCCEAIEILQQWQPELLLLDMGIPVVDGHELMRHIHGRPSERSVVVVALTSSDLENGHSLFLSTGCDDYLSKPLQAEQILDKLAEHLDVCYIYDQAEPTVAPRPSPSVKISTQRLKDHIGSAAQAWIIQLEQAARLADSDLIAELIQEVQPSHPQLGQAVEHIVYSFRYDILIQVARSHLERACEHDSV